MVVTLAILTVIVCLAIDFLRQRRAPAAAAVVEPKAPGKVVERFLHPGHGWAMVEESGKARVGVDELVGRLLGNPERVELPAAGDLVRQGEPLATLRRGRRALTVASPLTGRVLESNPELAAQPALARCSPHEKGWFARIAPSNLAVEMRSLLGGAGAEAWREAVDSQVRSWFAPGLGVVLQDGGEWVEDLGERMSDEDWDRMAQEFFRLRPVKSA